MTKYAFKTIVAPEAVRADFTTLRDMLMSSDKELMQAFWNLGLANPEAIKNELAKLKEQTALQRAEKQEFKAAAKLKEKAPKAEKAKVAAKKVPKKAKKADKVASVSFVDDGDDELSCVVVDGTK
jgi:hypothetical protein